MPPEDEDKDDWKKLSSKIGYSDFVICDADVHIKTQH
jgi:hypothetical protein